MAAAKSNPWNNNWFDVYDFTPHKFKQQNYTLQELPDQKWKEVQARLREQMKQAGIR
jgi:hypothetical protein